MNAQSFEKIRTLIRHEWCFYCKNLPITIFTLLISYFSIIYSSLMHCHAVWIIFEWWNPYNNKMMNRLTTRISNSLYIFSRKRTAAPNFLQLYQSAVFKCTLTTMQPRILTTFSLAASLHWDISKFCPLCSPVYA